MTAVDELTPSEHSSGPLAGLNPAACGELPVMEESTRSALAQAVAADPQEVFHHPVFNLVEQVHPTVVGKASNLLRVSAWNANRCVNPEEASLFLKSLGADVHLLSELDYGMARSGQKHTVRDIATQLECGYAFAVEFVELELGNRAERSAYAGQKNNVGYHGNAIVSPLEVGRAAVVRLRGAEPAWIDGSHGERRLGARMAVIGTIALASTEIVLVSTHLESHCPPQVRASQMIQLIAAIDAYRPGLPILIGGDFNTRTMSKAAFKHGSNHTPSSRERFVDPVAWEPLFECAAAAGFEWTAYNTAEATQFTLTGPNVGLPPAKLDWFFSRGLSCLAATIVPAIDASGQRLSDHDAITVDIAVAGTNPTSLTPTG